MPQKKDTISRSGLNKLIIDLYRSGRTVPSIEKEVKHYSIDEMGGTT